MHRLVRAGLPHAAGDSDNQRKSETYPKGNGPCPADAPVNSNKIVNSHD